MVTWNGTPSGKRFCNSVGKYPSSKSRMNCCVDVSAAPDEMKRCEETHVLTVERSKRPVEKKDPVGVKRQIDRIDSLQGRYMPWTVRMLWCEMHFTLAGHNIQFADILHHSIEIDRHDRRNRFICEGKVKTFVVEGEKVNEPGRQVGSARDAVGSWCCCCCWCSTWSASSKVSMLTLSGSLSSPTTSRPRSMSRSYWNEWDSTKKRGPLSLSRLN